MKKRIWELDALRGVFMIAIMLFHLWYDLVYLFDVAELTTPLERGLYGLMNDFGGTPFLLISGVCVTIGSRCIKRGLQVIGGGLIISAVTFGMYLLNFADKGIIIYFGVLHCIGVCMLLWPLFRKLPVPVLFVLGVVFAAVGLWLRGGVYVDFPWLIPLGLPTRSFVSSDYFPLLPNLGYFLIGAAAGLTVYQTKTSLLPGVNADHFLIRPFCFIGRNSLIFYLLHQPVLAGAVSLWLQFL